MSVSLYTLTVETYRQFLPQVARLIDKAEAHCRDRGLPAEALTAAALAPDMWNFAKQVFECGHHSARALASVRSGVAGPEIDPAPLDVASLHAEIAAALAFVETVDPAELDGIAGRDMRFEFGTTRMDFTVADFLLSFSLPSFHFHFATAYGVLRNQGVAVGKRDYLGQLRLRTTG